MVAPFLGRFHRAGEEVGAHPVGDEGLRSVDHVSPRHLAREGADAGDVGAGAGLGDPERADLLAADAGHDPALPLFLRAEVEHRRHRDLGVSVEARGDAARAAGAGQLLDPHRVVDVVPALAAVSLRELEAEKAELAAAREELARELPRLLPLVHVRSDLLGDEASHALTKLLVLLGEGREHRPLAGVPDHGAQAGALQSRMVV